MPSSPLPNRLYSFLVPWFTDGALSMATATVPLLALKLGAGPLALGTIGLAAQVARLPLCLVSGRLSEIVGRKTVTIPAAVQMIAACLLLTMATRTWHLVVLYAMVMTSMALFYPPFQALLGDISPRGQLTQNVGAFNVGWCVGSAVAALVTGYLLVSGLWAPFAAAVGLMLVTISILVFWPVRRADKEGANDQAIPAPPADYSRLLTIARLGHFTAFYGYASIRILFPKIGVDLGWSDSQITKITSLLMWGQGAGIIGAGLAPWWRGRIWPQVSGQLVMCAAAAAVGLVTSPGIVGTLVGKAALPAVVGAAFFAFGVALAVVYSGALYYSLSARSNMGKQAGIHESLVALGNISGCLIGGLAAQYISLQMPYFLLAGVALAAFATTIVLCAQDRKVAMPARQD